MWNLSSLFYLFWTILTRKAGAVAYYYPNLSLAPLSSETSNGDLVDERVATEKWFLTITVTQMSGSPLFTDESGESRAIFYEGEPSVARLFARIADEVEADEKLRQQSHGEQGNGRSERKAGGEREQEHEEKFVLPSESTLYSTIQEKGEFNAKDPELQLIYNGHVLDKDDFSHQTLTEQLSIENQSEIELIAAFTPPKPWFLHLSPPQKMERGHTISLGPNTEMLLRRKYGKEGFKNDRLYNWRGGELLWVVRTKEGKVPIFGIGDNGPEEDVVLSNHVVFDSEDGGCGSFLPVGYVNIPGNICQNNDQNNGQESGNQCGSGNQNGKTTTGVLDAIVCLSYGSDCGPEWQKEWKWEGTEEEFNKVFDLVWKEFMDYFQDMYSHIYCGNVDVFNFGIDNEDNMTNMLKNESCFSLDRKIKIFHNAQTPNVRDLINKEFSDVDFLAGESESYRLWRRWWYEGRPSEEFPDLKPAPGFRLCKNPAGQYCSAFWLWKSVESGASTGSSRGSGLAGIRDHDDDKRGDIVEDGFETPTGQWSPSSSSSSSSSASSSSSSGSLSFLPPTRERSRTFSSALESVEENDETGFETGSEE